MAKFVGVASTPKVYISRKDGKKTTYYKVYWTPFPGGKKKWSWVEADSRGDAFHKRQDLIAAETARLIKTEAPVDGFSKMLQTLLSNIEADGRSKKYVSAHRNTFERIYRDFKEIYEKRHNIKIVGLKDIDSSFYSEYHHHYTHELKMTGWRAEVIRLKNQLKRLRRFKYCVRDLVEDVKEALPTPEGIRRHYDKLSHEEIKKLFDYMKKDRPDYYRPIRFMYLTGRRLVESTLYEKIDIDRDDNLMPIALRPKPKNTKTKKRSVIYLVGELKTLIKDALRDNNTIWVFPNKHGRVCQDSGLYKYLTKTSKEIIKKRINPHFFRHDFHRENMSTDMKATMSISGLTSIKVAMDYYDESSADRQAIILEKSKGKGV
jgi:site-specific recombinase XerD